MEMQEQNVTHHLKTMALGCKTMADTDPSKRLIMMSITQLIFNTIPHPEALKVLQSIMHSPSEAAEQGPPAEKSSSTNNENESGESEKSEKSPSVIDPLGVTPTNSTLDFDFSGLGLDSTNDKIYPSHP